jgi:hypothetical protein
MNLNTFLRRLKALGYVIVLWHIDDVKAVRPDLTEDQCREVLSACEQTHNAEVSLLRDILRIHADELFPEPEEPVT